MRNLLYDTNVLRSSRFSVPIISVGNLVVGGAGKTPHIEYLIHLLNPYLEIGTLSRGYNRKTSGYRSVSPNDTALTVGDEPLMYAKKYNDILVSVAENRALGIPQMVMQKPNIQAILLDDAFQHRSVQPYVNILLTAYDSPFTEDILIPAGRLRESAEASKRADMVIVSKCPESLSQGQRQLMIDKLKLKSDQEVYFSKYVYGYPYSMYNVTHQITLNKSMHAVSVSAIANTSYMISYLQPILASIIELNYADHYNFSSQDVDYIIDIFQKREQSNKILLTTEKDAIRLAIHLNKFLDAKIPIFVLPLRVVFLQQDGKQFDDSIKKRLLSFQN
jgi:tetraacyldisaccharide 4'-kinase